MRNHIRDALVRVVRRNRGTAGDIANLSHVTIRDVIKEAGISTGTFYRYFEDRSDLTQLLWVEPVDALRAAMRADFEAAQDPEEKVRCLLQNYAKFAVENRQFFRTIFMFVRPETSEPPTQMVLHEEPFYSGLCEAFVEGQTSGTFRDFDPNEMAQTFWAAIHGSLALPENLDRLPFDSPKTLSDRMIDSLIELIKLSN
ncbi:MAG: TetR/AcrR family transcriptional regulator [Pseudomonadota bacterium]